MWKPSLIHIVLVLSFFSHHPLRAAEGAPLNATYDCSDPDHIRLIPPKAQPDNQPPVEKGYCAIAYSPGIQISGCSYGQPSQDQAEKVALAQCPFHDAKIVGWTRNGFVVLVGSSDGGWGCGKGKTKEEAEQAAIQDCPGRDARLVQWVKSFD